MLAKLIVTILMIGVTAGSLLVMRQERIDAAHDMAVLHAQKVSVERQLCGLRLMVHEQLNHDDLWSLIRQYEAETGITMVPFNLDECINRCPPPDDIDRTSSIVEE